jgi:hypothetical protein
MKMRKSMIAAAAGVLIPAAGVLAAPTPPAPKPGPGGGTTTTVPSYGLGTEQFETTIGPGGVPAGNGQAAISSSQVVVGGTLTTTQLPDGDIEATFVQGYADNTYGTNASPLWGKQGHTFNDLLGSDKAEFQFTDSKGNVVLAFDVDYIGQAKSSPVTIANGLSVSYPSGYGTLGVLGGDGKMITGDSSNIKYIDTTLTDDLNNPEFNPVTHPGTLVNSPTSPDWNNVNGYTVIISAAAFGSNGFGSVAIPQIHDSPARPFSLPSVPLPSTAMGVGVLCVGLLASKRLRRATV